MIASYQSQNYNNMTTNYINFCLNKFCPYFIIFFVLYFLLEFSEPLIYIIIPFIMYIDRFSFKAGYSIAYCESKGIELNS
jgi:hypothetical protein